MNWYFSAYASGSIESSPQSPEDIPQKVGTTPIPDGHVRLYHQTPLENAESIRTHGIIHDKMKGIEGPRRIYVWRTPFYGESQSHATVELHVPEELFDPPQFLKISDVPPEYIVAVHEPWHDRARYLISEFPTVDSMIESFGENWQEYISTIDEAHMKALQAYIRHLNIGSSPDKGLKKEAALPTRRPPPGYKSGSVPFDTQAVNSYGAWLASDGEYILVKFEEHHEAALDILEDVPSKSIGADYPYGAMYEQGYIRVLFMMKASGQTVSFESKYKIDPNRIVEAMRDFPQYAIWIDAEGFKEYENLTDFKAKNGMMSTDTGVSDSLRSVLETPDLMRAPPAAKEKEEEYFSAYASIMGWIQKTCAFARKP